MPLTKIKLSICASSAVTGESRKVFWGCCTADSQADEDRNQLNNYLKIDELETFASDCSSEMNRAKDDFALAADIKALLPFP